MRCELSKQSQMRRLQALESQAAQGDSLADEIPIMARLDGVLVATHAPRKWPKVDYRSGIWQIAPVGEHDEM